MPQFHETMQGRKFFEADLPRLIKALEKIADELYKVNNKWEKEIEANIRGTVSIKQEKEEEDTGLGGGFSSY